MKAVLLALLLAPSLVFAALDLREGEYSIRCGRGAQGTREFKEFEGKFWIYKMESTARYVTAKAEAELKTEYPDPLRGGTVDGNDSYKGRYIKDDSQHILQLENKKLSLSLNLSWNRDQISVFGSTKGSEGFLVGTGPCRIEKVK